MTRDDLSCFLGFQKFSGEDPRTPLPDQEMWLIFQSNTVQCKHWVKSNVSTKGAHNSGNFHIDLWWDGYIFVA